MCGLGLLVTFPGFSQIQPDEVKTYRVNAFLGGAVVRATGTIKPMHEVIVGSEISGRVKSVYVDVNDYVDKDTLLAQLDSSAAEIASVVAKEKLRAAKLKVKLIETQIARQRIEIDRLSVQVEQIKTSIASMKVDLEEAQNSFARAEALGLSGVASETEVTALKANLYKKKANLSKILAEEKDLYFSREFIDVEMEKLNVEKQIAFAEIEANEAEVESLLQAIERAKIRAPMKGVVLSKNIEAGQVISAQFEAPELFVIAATLSKIRVVASVNEVDVLNIKSVKQAYFTVSSAEQDAIPLFLDRISLYPRKHDSIVLYDVILHGENPGERFFPGMTVTVEFKDPIGADMFVLPNDAIVTLSDKKNVIARLNARGELEWIEVKVIEKNATHAVFKATDINIGDLIQVVTSTVIEKLQSQLSVSPPIQRQFGG